MMCPSRGPSPGSLGSTRRTKKERGSKPIASEDDMTIHQVSLSVSMLSVLLFTGGIVLAEESKRTTDPTKGNKTGMASERSTNQGQDSSGKKGKDSLGRAGVEPT